VEIGWGLLHGPGDPESVLENLARLVREGISGISWLSLADPQPGIRSDPPWGLREGLTQAGLLDPRLTPRSIPRHGSKDSDRPSREKPILISSISVKANTSPTPAPTSPGCGNSTGIRFDVMPFHSNSKILFTISPAL